MEFIKTVWLSDWTHSHNLPATVLVSHCYVFTVLSSLMVVQTFYIYMLEVDKIHLKFHHLMKYCRGEFSVGLRDEGQTLVTSSMIK